MEISEVPEVKCGKNTIPSVYLDTCIMIELGKFEKGICKNEHIKEIGELYEVLEKLKQKGVIICPLGNQLEEMGMTKEREDAKYFLYDFTNSKLHKPSVISNLQLKESYEAFVNSRNLLELGTNFAFEKDEHPDSKFTIHVAPVYTPEKAETLRSKKMQLVDVLNEMKKSGKIESDFESQLKTELLSDLQLLIENITNNPFSSEEDCARYIDEIGEFHSITLAEPYCSDEKLKKEFERYVDFLCSTYHHKIPCVWIRANLWAHLMQRQDKIVRGDNLDIQWAAAYLPFVDYAITDDKFRLLLQNSGLAEQYGTKVYSLKTLKDFLIVVKSFDN